MGTWTTTTETAIQINYKRTDAVGRHKDGSAMETDEAEARLEKAKYSIRTIIFELFTNDADPAPCFLKDVSVSARADSIEQEKAKALKQLKEDLDDDTLYLGTGYDIDTTTYKVESFKMESNFDPDRWEQLGHPDADDEANEYHGRLYWTYQEILPNGSLGDKKEDDEYFDFLSYTYNAHSHTDCEENQVISDVPHISDCITRKFVVKPIEKAVVTKAYETYRTNMVQTGTKIDVEHYEKIYE